MAIQKENIQIVHILLSNANVDVNAFKIITIMIK